MSHSHSRSVGAPSEPRRPSGHAPGTSRVRRSLWTLSLGWVLLPLLGAPTGLSAQTPGEVMDRVGSPFVSVRVRAERIPSLARNISVDLRSASLQEALSQIAAHAGLRLTYSTDLLPAGYQISLREREISAADAVVRILRGTTLDLLVAPSGEAVLVRCAPSVCGPSPGALRARIRGDLPLIALVVGGATTDVSRRLPSTPTRPLGVSWQ